MAEIRVTETRRKDLEQILHSGAKVHKQLEALFRENSIVCFTVAELSTLLSGVADSAVAKKLALNIVSLNRYAEDSQETPTEVISILCQNLKNAGWSVADADPENSMFKMMKAGFESELVKMTAKSSDLFYKHAWHLHELKFVTDMRPVLNLGRDKVSAVILKNTLVLIYSDGGETEKTIEIAVGDDEISEIARQANSAIEKTKLLKNVVDQKLEVPSKVYGKIHG